MAHAFNRGRRQAPTPLPPLVIKTFDLKNFFTLVPRERFRRDIQQTVQELQQINASWKFFCVEKEKTFRTLDESKSRRWGHGAFRKHSDAPRWHMFFSARISPQAD